MALIPSAGMIQRQVKVRQYRAVATEGMMNNMA
jgi:hypothetical protein